MEYRTFGKTGKKVSILGFGGMRFSRDEDLGAAAMLRAYELGINFFDTAPFYCRDRSLDIFGQALPRMDRSSILVSSKSGIGSDKTESDVRRRVEEMLTRMRIDYLDFLCMWCVFDLDQYRKIIAPAGPYQGALKLKEEGLVRHINISIHATTPEIITMCEEGLFEGVILSFNVINHRVRIEGIRAASRLKMGVISMNPLGGGLIPSLEESLKQRGKAKEDLTASALRFTASHKGICVVLSGMKSPDEVEQNVAALSGQIETRASDGTRLEEHLSRFGTRFCTLCRYCLPCPEGIDIPAFMSTANFRKAGLHDLAAQAFRFRRSKVRAENCTECGQCEEKCTQSLNIVETLRNIESKFGKAR